MVWNADAGEAEESLWSCEGAAKSDAFWEALLGNSEGGSRSCLLIGVGSRSEGGTSDLSASRQAPTDRLAAWASDLARICSFGGSSAGPFRSGGTAG